MCVVKSCCPLQGCKFVHYVLPGQIASQHELDHRCDHLRSEYSHPVAMNAECRHIRRKSNRGVALNATHDIMGSREDMDAAIALSKQLKAEKKVRQVYCWVSTIQCSRHLISSIDNSVCITYHFDLVNVVSTISGWNRSPWACIAHLNSVPCSLQLASC